MLNIYLARHGETEYNANGNRYCGKTDIGLTPKGMLQAEALHQLVATQQFDAVYCSPLDRARRTAQTAVPDQAIHIDERLIELDFGAWEGKTRTEFIAENEELWTNWNKDPKNNRAGGTGETAGQLIARLDDFIQEVIQKHPQGHILIVAHNGVNRFLMAHLLGLPLQNYRKIKQHNATLTVLEYEETEGFSLVKLNCVYSK